jgi:hypothetical protein
MNRRARLQNDDGSVVVIALVFVLVVGLVVGVLLTQTMSGFRTTQVVRKTADKTYAADAGIEWAIESLRVDSRACVTSGTPASMTSTPLDVNGQPVAVTCEVLDGWATGADGWAVYVTDPTQSGLTTQGADAKDISGPVYSAGINDTAALAVTRGSVYERQSGSTCSTNNDRPPAVNASPGPPYSYACVAAAQAPPVPTATLPAAPPTPTRGPNPEAYTVNGWSVFLPGTYNQAPNLAARNYFASGVYYFNDVGTWVIKQETVVGGQPGPSEELITPDLINVPNDTNLPGASGSGVRFILGGNSRIDMQTQSTLELFARSEMAGEGTPGISLQTVTTSGGGWNPSTLGVTSNVLTVENGTSPQAVFHGRIHVPNAAVNFVATNESEAQIRHGIVAGRLNLQSSSSATGLIVIGGTSTTGRRVEVTAVAGDGTDGRQITAIAQIDLADNDAADYQIVSWVIDRAASDQLTP